MTAINDLRIAFWGGQDEEKATLEAALASGLSAADLIAMIDTGTPIGVVFAERTDPDAPADTKVVLYARDNGGKTELAARFASGAVQQVAIEP